jgi:glycosyltransferase involved in cell wall biosynthesis
LGVDWIRKGGNVALKVTKELNQSGLPTQLTIVGCQPLTDEPLPNFVNVIPFINKSNSDDAEFLNKLISKSHFLILPSLADCTPVVFSEANSLAVPVLSTDVGGITSIIRNDLNGKAFSITAHPSDYCNYISDLFTNYSQYQQLCFSSFYEYQTRLNWTVAVKTVKKLLQNIL